MGPWLLGPGYRPRKSADQYTPFAGTDYELVDQEEARAPMHDKWNTYYVHVHTAGHILCAVLKSNGAQPLVTDDDDKDLEAGGKGLMMPRILKQVVKVLMMRSQIPMMRSWTLMKKKNNTVESDAETDAETETEAEAADTEA